MSYQVTIEPIGTTIEVEEDQTILDAALRQGVWLPFACGHGTCGTCKVQVTDGFMMLVKPRHLHSWILNVMKIRCLPAAANHNPTWSLKPMLMKTQIS